MKKKGFVFIPLLVILSIVVLTLAYYLFLTVERKSTNNVLGEIQVDSFKEIYDSEKSLLEIDNQIKYIIIKSLNKLADRGGVKEDNLWTEGSVRGVKNLFKETFEREFNDYFNKNYLDLKYAYSYSYDEGRIKIIGIANKELEFNKNLISYKVRPNFQVNINYDLDEYGKMYNYFRDFKECPGQERLREIKASWNMINCVNGNSWTYFEVESKDLGYIKPVIKFKIPKNS